MDQPVTDSALHVRDATPDDIPAIAAIYGQAVAHGVASFEIEPPSEEEMLRRMRLLLDGNYPYVVAERQGEVVGYAYAGPHHSRPGYRWTVDSSIYVSPAAQRGGVGSVLLGRIVADAEARGFRQMIAVIGDSANAGSIAVHRRHGFRDVGTFRSVGRKHGRWLDSVHMQRALGEGDGTPPPGEAQAPAEA